MRGQKLLQVTRLCDRESDGAAGGMVRPGGRGGAEADSRLGSSPRSWGAGAPLQTHMRKAAPRRSEKTADTAERIKGPREKASV